MSVETIEGPILCDSCGEMRSRVARLAVAGGLVELCAVCLVAALEAFPEDEQ